VELFYRKYGEGVPLIIVHGLYGASDNWVSIGRQLAKNYEVFLIDQRNHGRSPHSSEHTYDLMVEDLYEFIDVHDIEKAILLGHSMGGKTVMQFAKKYPEKVDALIVLDIAPKSYAQAAKKQEPDNRKGQIGHYSILKAMKNIDFSLMKTRNDVDTELASTIIDLRIRQFLLKNIYRAKDNSLSWRINVDVLYNNLDEIMEGEIDTGFEQIIGFPVLFVRGADSSYIQDSDIEQIKRIFPYAELETIDDAGHWLHAEQPDKLVSLIVDFLF